MSIPEILPSVKPVFEKLGEPKDVYTYFLNYTQVPHGSNQPGENTNHLPALEIFKKWSNDLKLEYKIDEIGNIVIRKPASPGCEGKQSICIQAHMDMVCQNTPETAIDFKKDPLKPRIVDDKWLMATGTSLGADDGIGVAAGFALLADTKIKHGPLELLITRDEEVGLIGAAKLGPGMINSKLLINVDSEEEDSICFGCAGGFQFNTYRPVSYDADFKGRAAICGIEKFHGGHTGVDCNVGFANPLKLIGRMLKAAEFEGINYRLCSIVGGTAQNAIPRDAIFEVLVEEAKYDAFISFINKQFEIIKIEYAVKEPEICIQWAEHPTVYQAMNEKDTKQLVDFFNVCHDGPYRMSPDVDGLVESSLMTTIAGRDERGFVITGSGRSSSNSQLEHLFKYIKNLTVMCGFIAPEKINPYPGWLPNPKSQLLANMKAVYDKEINRKKDGCHVYAIHAGLECGLVQDKYEGLDCASIGPTIQNPHSPSERLLIESVPRFYIFLKKTIESFAI